MSLVLSYHRGAVWGWTPRDYEDTVERPLSSRDPFAPEVTDFVHAIMAPAQDCEIDAAGRIRIPQPLRDRAGLDRDVVVTSVQNRLEIWDRAAWERAYEMAVANYEKRGGMPGFGT